PEPFFALDVKDWQPGQALAVDGRALGCPHPLAKLPAGTYSIQAVMDFDRGGRSFSTAEGNGYSKAVRRALDPPATPPAPPPRSPPPGRPRPGPGLPRAPLPRDAARQARRGREQAPHSLLPPPHPAAGGGRAPRLLRFQSPAPLPRRLRDPRLRRHALHGPHA